MHVMCQHIQTAFLFRNELSNVTHGLNALAKASLNLYLEVPYCKAATTTGGVRAATYIYCSSPQTTITAHQPTRRIANVIMNDFEGEHLPPW